MVIRKSYAICTIIYSNLFIFHISHITTYIHICAYSKLILVPISHKSYRAYTYTEVLIHVLVLLSILYLFRFPVGVTELIPIRRYLYTYLYFYLSYICSDLGVTELILVLRNLYLYYGPYFCTTELILVLRSLYMYYETYTCTEVPVGTTDPILVQRYP